MTDPLIMLVFVVACAPVIIPVIILIVGVWLMAIGYVVQRVKRWWYWRKAG